MTDEKVIATSQVVILLYDALEMREDCKDCGGSGTQWHEHQGEVEPEPCECIINAACVLEHCKQSYTNAQILLEGLAT